MESREIENRIEPRRRCDIYLNKFMGDEPFMVRADNISATGIYLHKLIEPDLPDGSIVSLEFQLPGSEEVIWARGAVVREGQFWGAGGVGIFFTTLPGRYRDLIESFVSSN